MRGTGPVKWGSEVVYTFFTMEENVINVRLSMDEADRLNVIEGVRVNITLPHRTPVNLLVTAIVREPPFVWVELATSMPEATGEDE
jgi:hypothetical protein